MNLSIGIVLHVIAEDINLEAHSYALHFNKKILIYKIISKKDYRYHNTVQNFEHYLL